jgi:isorenieratene synthase
MKVLVAGGGLAGLASATILAEAGHEVVVVEREGFLGGRAGAWTETLGDGTELQMERGFHAFFRQYRCLRALMRRVDPELSMLRRAEDYPVHGPGGEVQSFRDLPTRTPLNVATLAWRSPTIGLMDLPRVRVGPTLAMVSFGEHTWTKWDRMSAKDYLDALNFPPEARRMLFEVFSHSFFNPEDDFSAAELLMQFHFYFLANPEGLVFDTMDRPFSTGLFDPLAAYLRRRGVRFLMSTEVTSVDLGRDPVAVHLRSPAGEAREDAEALVLGLSVPGLRALGASSPSLAMLLGAGLGSLEVTSPFAVWRLWLDREVRSDRLPFVGTVGMGIIDNISVYERLEDESAAWTRRHGGSVVELHAYALPPEMEPDAIRAELLEGLHATYPETRGATILHDRFLLRQDCPAFRPASHADRPGVTTGDPRVKLAGDFVKMPFPCALMERATASGFAAANELLGFERQPVLHGPTRGPLALLRF